MATPSKSRSPEAPALPSSAGPVEPPPLAFFACPNPDCASFNVFGGDNLSVAEYMGTHKAIRRLYCKVCHGRFSERQGSLLQDGKLPPAEVVRIVKCFGYGLPVAATADICEGDPRTVQRLLEKGGQRAHDFHQSQLERAQAPLEAVHLDEMHGHVAGDTRDEKGGLRRWLRRRKPAARR